MQAAETAAEAQPAVLFEREQGPYERRSGVRTTRSCNPEAKVEIAARSACLP